jgi:hypothetical protein
MMARKLWKITWPEVPRSVERPESQAAAYRYVRAQAANWQCDALRSPLLNVYVDERDGQGWQLYERIDLRELPGGD